MERGGDALWRVFKKRPVIGIVVAAFTGLGLATLGGASELAVAVASSVAAYQLPKKHEPPSKALADAARFARARLATASEPARGAAPEVDL
jgi:hypothetical protein